MSHNNPYVYYVYRLQKRTCTFCKGQSKKELCNILQIILTHKYSLDSMMFKKIFIFNNYNNSSDVPRGDTKGSNKNLENKTTKVTYVSSFCSMYTAPQMFSNDGDMGVVLECHE